MIRSFSLPFLVALAFVVCGITPPLYAQSIDTGNRGFSYRFNVDYFVQFSSRQSFAYGDERFADDETFMWERLRPKVSGTNGRVSFLLEGQDTHSRGSEYTVRKAWLDILNAYVDINGPRGLSFRVGRRQGDFEAVPRLIRTPDFAAVVRSFDVAEVRWQRRRTEARAFFFRTVDNLPDRFNTWKKGERLWTTFLQQGVGRQRLQTYVTTRLNTDSLSESGTRGGGAIYAWQTMASGPTGIPRLSYSIENILERGHASTDRIRANGTFVSLSSEPVEGHDFEMRYLRTSGDQAVGDGTRGAYDTFYPASGQLSPLGLMRGPNLNSISIGANHRVAPKLVLTWRVHEHRLNTLNDGWYSTRFIRREGATSPRLGTETDMLATFTLSSRLTARAGYFRLFPGGYISNTGTHGSPHEVRVQLFGSF